ncbi:MAG: hypothetical protein PHS44_00885 [Candidatus Dojkabacteria bacterium]|jgi:hypothetical protein|nr:hypothetical protein [Candidatus Dojkabacteria bacterium]
MERNNSWLEELMYDLWEDYFNDVPRRNYVLIKFGRGAKRQLGSIKWVRGDTRVKKLLKSKMRELDGQDDDRITVITITSLFKSLRVPEYVVKSTVAHEMVHYAHGFFSPLKQIYNHPHKGGLIRKELTKRGLYKMYQRSKKWLKEKWYR